MVEPLILYGKQDVVQEIAGTVSNIGGADGPYIKGKVGALIHFMLSTIRGGGKAMLLK